jgi:two-component system NtrC family sensor kinase
MTETPNDAATDPQKPILELQRKFAERTAERDELLQQQNATAEILKVIASSQSDVQPVFEAIATSANRLIGGFSTAVFRFVNSACELAAFTPTSPAADEILKVSFPQPLTYFAPLQMVTNGETVQISDTENAADFQIKIARARGFRSIMFSPLMSGGAVIGMISVTREEPSSFAVHHVKLLQTFANQAVIAIENARLFNESKEALERQTATADILKVIASSPDDVQPVFDAIAAKSNRLVDGFSTSVYGLVDDTVHLRALTSTSSAADAGLKALFPRPLSTFPFSEAFRKGEIVRIVDTEKESVVPSDLRDAARLRGWRSWLAVPLLREARLIGIITVTRADPGLFADKHVELLKTFADQAVIAISNVELFNEVQARTSELSTSLDELRATQHRLVQTEKLASLGQLTAGIAHEIKNPLNFVNNFSALSAELIDELDETLAPVSLDQKTRGDVSELTQMLKSNLDKVVQHGKRADSIVKNMLLHSREGSGEQRSADINVLVEESLNLAYHGARAEKPGFNVMLKHDLDPDAGSAELYPQEITRALLNLISNGFYAATQRKSIEGDAFEAVLIATTKNCGKTVEIRIRDNGTGIPDELKEKIFNPFFTTKPSGEGTGLGLSMSHDIIVKQHGGTIDVVTEPGVFTEFTVVLPRTSQR